MTLPFFGKPINPFLAISNLFLVNLEYLYFLIIILELYFITPLLSVFFQETGQRSKKIFIAASFFLTMSVAAVNAIFSKDAIYLNRNIATIFIPYIGYFAIGPYLNKIRLSLSSVISLALVYLYITIFVAIVSNGVIGSYFRNYGSVTIIAMTFISFVCLMRFDYWKALSTNKFAKQTIQYLASLIFGVYLMHMMVIFLIDKYFDLEPGAFLTVSLPAIGLKTVFVLVASFVLVAIGKKIPYLKFLFI